MPYSKQGVNQLHHGQTAAHAGCTCHLCVGQAAAGGEPRQRRAVKMTRPVQQRRPCPCPPACTQPTTYAVYCMYSARSTYSSSPWLIFVHKHKKNAVKLQPAHEHNTATIDDFCEWASPSLSRPPDAAGLTGICVRLQSQAHTQAGPVKVQDLTCTRTVVDSAGNF